MITFFYFYPKPLFPLLLDTLYFQIFYLNLDILILHFPLIFPWFLCYKHRVDYLYCLHYFVSMPYLNFIFFHIFMFIVYIEILFIIFLLIIIYFHLLFLAWNRIFLFYFVFLFGFQIVFVFCIMSHIHIFLCLPSTFLLK